VIPKVPDLIDDFADLQDADRVDPTGQIRAIQNSPQRLSVNTTESGKIGQWQGVSVPFQNFLKSLERILALSFADCSFKLGLNLVEPRL